MRHGYCTVFRRNGKPRLQLVAGPQDNGGGWAEADEPKRIESGIWIVVKLPTSVPEGHFKEERSFRMVTPDLDGISLREADTGLLAIQDFYLQCKKDQERESDGDLSEADGRYIALDFYGNHREEALVVGGWRADVTVAPQALGRPDD